MRFNGMQLMTLVLMVWMPVGLGAQNAGAATEGRPYKWWCEYRRRNDFQKAVSWA